MMLVVHREGGKPDGRQNESVLVPPDATEPLRQAQLACVAVELDTSIYPVRFRNQGGGYRWKNDFCPSIRL